MMGKPSARQGLELTEMGRTCAVFMFVPDAATITITVGSVGADSRLGYEEHRKLHAAESAASKTTVNNAVPCFVPWT